jgi:uncharacterized protein
MPSARQLLALAAVCAVSVAAYATLRGGPSARAAVTDRGATVRFQGSGTVELRPDRASIHFTTSGRGASLAAATERASAAMRRVVAAMRAGGVAAADMTTDAVEGSPRPRAGGYRASQGLTVDVRRVSQTGALLSAGAAAGASSTYGPEFSLGDRRRGEGRALEAAVRDARARAAAAATAAGLRLTGVVSISDEGGGPIYAVGELARAGAVKAAVPISPGRQEVSATVTVRFSVAAA